MRSDGSAATLPYATRTGAPVLLTVFIEPNSEPITGWLETEGDPRRSFSDWLELTAMLAVPYASAGPTSQRDLRVLDRHRTEGRFMETRTLAAAMTSREVLTEVFRYRREVADDWRPSGPRDQWVGPHDPFRHDP
jgi:hypothetical protein